MTPKRARPVVENDAYAAFGHCTLAAYARCIARGGIDTRTVQVLREHRSRQAAEQLAGGTDWRGTDDYVFTIGWGEPVHPDTVS